MAETTPADNGFAEIETWVFDLDNTLYPVTERLLALIDLHMGEFIATFLDVDLDEAHRVQKGYFKRYGLTLRGLMLHHGLDPAHYFEQMKPMDLDEITPDPALAAAIGRLPGRKIIYTNASARHAEMVLERLGMAGLFAGIFDIAAADYLPKPALKGYQELCRRHRIDPTAAAMVDDIARNLEPAADLGMITIWKRTNAEWARDVAAADHIHHVVDDLCGWLEDIAATER
jgi:putative hydrolase of the HAD superfamily